MWRLYASGCLHRWPSTSHNASVHRCIAGKRDGERDWVAPSATPPRRVPACSSKATLLPQYRRSGVALLLCFGRTIPGVGDAEPVLGSVWHGYPTAGRSEHAQDVVGVQGNTQERARCRYSRRSPRPGRGDQPRNRWSGWPRPPRQAIIFYATIERVGGHGRKTAIPCACIWIHVAYNVHWTIKHMHALRSKLKPFWRSSRCASTVR